MEPQEWLDQLRKECAGQHLPPRYVARLVRELSDHLLDVKEDTMSTGVNNFGNLSDRLGMPGDVAAKAAREYRLRHFSSRHPVLMFILSPIIAMPLLWLAPVFCLVLVAQAFGLGSGLSSASTDLSQGWNTIAQLAVMGYVLVPIAVAAAFYSRLAIKSALSWKWTLATCVILALISSMAVASVTLPTTGSRGKLLLGFGISQNPSPQQLLQFALPLAIGGWAIYRQMGRRSTVTST